MTEALTIDEIIALEKQYGSIYKIEILEYTFYWRELTQLEYNKANGLFNDEEEQAEYICRVCVIKPKDFDFGNCYAGIPTTLCKAILLQSGYNDGHGKRMLEYYRQEMTKFENQIVPIICAAFPALDPELVDQWALNKQIKYLGMAEWIFNNLKGIPFKIGEEPEIDYDAFPELRGT